MRRRPDWPQRLESALEAARAQPFVWGEHDCVLFATRVAAELTGVDRAAPWRGRYRNQFGAEKILRQAGGLAVLVTRQFGDPMPVERARRGDLLLACRDTGMAVGVCVGTRGAFAGPEGLAFLPLNQCVQAWLI